MSCNLMSTALQGYVCNGYLKNHPLQSSVAALFSTNIEHVPFQFADLIFNRLVHVLHKQIGLNPKSLLPHGPK